ncbi:diguanylate cyclase (GGDEF) domain-containing protein [Paenibacillus sp. UNC496MF]|uniref:diguanylate cyclase domain-containing protein n=1 Tax=Paenibacillus sp. UNC496MF TaxID=1502753 RepID=UPI0008EC2C3B|nr:diguanylate cyclase [Paenibacillus sp. UNC496MF]SFI74451.1 diguanylate cyclase (GGDEF) domain-containing protein [Paenibacillus sp. UNC496MF]
MNEQDYGSGTTFITRKGAPALGEVVDSSTGVPGRKAAFAMLARAVVLARQTGRRVVAALVDVDRFYIVNETKGTAFGDEALRQIARRLKRLRGRRRGRRDDGAAPSAAGMGLRLLPGLFARRTAGRGGGRPAAAAGGAGALRRRGRALGAGDAAMGGSGAARVRGRGRRERAIKRVGNNKGSLRASGPRPFGPGSRARAAFFCGFRSLKRTREV